MSAEDFNASELELVGAAFVNDLQNHSAKFSAPEWRGRARWTHHVLDWFAAACPGVVVDTSRSDRARARPTVETNALDASPVRDGHGEFMGIDLIASEGPEYASATYWSTHYWERFLERGSCAPLLALESEWKGDTAPERYAYVMHSAAKLAWVRARVKVLVFASAYSDHPLDSREGTLRDVKKLRAVTGDSASWLVIDVPWCGWNRIPPTHEVLG